VEPADCSTQTNGHGQKLPQLQRRGEQDIEGLAARVLKQEHTPALVVGEGEGPYRPSWMQIRLEGKGVRDFSERSRGGAFAHRCRDEKSRETRVALVLAAPAVQDELSILTKRFQRVFRWINHQLTLQHRLSLPLAWSRCGDGWLHG
jgi:hypothetical protein